MKKIARGAWQEEMWNKMVNGCEVIPFKSLKGNAKRYYGRYQMSFYAMIGRAKEQGYKILKKPGINGGEWGASFKIEN